MTKGGQYLQAAVMSGAAAPRIHLAVSNA